MWIDCFMRSNHALGNRLENSSLKAAVCLLQGRLRNNSKLTEKAHSNNQRKLLPTENLD